MARSATGPAHDAPPRPALAARRRVPGARARWRVLAQLEQWLERPMIVLAFVWLALLVVELTRGLDPLSAAVGLVIWGVFVADFLLRLALAPNRLGYLAGNWLTALSLGVPALRVVRVARLLPVVRLTRVARGARLVRVVSSVNRGMRALGTALGRRGFGYAALLTLVVTAAGAAGMLAFEGAALGGYADALWWTAMLITTMGTDYWPRTAEGRVLCFLLACYAFAVFGYVTATLASFFVGRDAEDLRRASPREAELAALRADVAALRAELRAARARPQG
jgi:voltage-gated potassium channel